MKEVYHSTDRCLYLRRLISGYGDLVKAGVRLKNQRYALLRSCGQKSTEKVDSPSDAHGEQFVSDFLERQIEAYENEKEGYERDFERLPRKNAEIKLQKSLPDIITHDSETMT